jgi:phage regulator Rha-like protein
MKKNIFTAQWFKEFKELQKKERAQAHKPSSTRAQAGRPQAKGSSFSPKSTSSRIRDPE